MLIIPYFKTIMPIKKYLIAPKRVHLISIYLVIEPLYDAPPPLVLPDIFKVASTFFFFFFFRERKRVLGSVGKIKTEVVGRRRKPERGN